jgi:hypothetical protein
MQLISSHLLALTDYLLFQRYFAEFRIKHTVYSIPADVFPSASELLRPSLAVAYLVIEVYHADMLTFIEKSVKENIALLDGSGDDGDALASKILKADLRIWMKQAHPFHYDALLHLVRIVNPGGVNLPPASEHQLNLDNFIDLLVDRARKSQFGGAPFIPHAQFQHILPFAVEKLTAHAAHLGKDAADHIRECLKQSMLSLHIHMIPWSPPHDGSRHRPIHSPRFNAWVTFGAVNTARLQSSSTALRPMERQEVAIRATQETAQNADANSPWEASSKTISKLYKVLNRRILPRDFRAPDFSTSEDSQYVRETYKYVRDNINLDHPLHHLALIIGIIFSHLCPDVFTEAPPLSAGGSAELHRSNEVAAKYLSTLPWSNRTDAAKKGNTQRDIYVCMVTTYIVALYDPKSPLRQYHSLHGKLGNPWTGKHSEFGCISMIEILSTIDRC